MVDPRINLTETEIKSLKKGDNITKRSVLDNSIFKDISGGDFALWDYMHNIFEFYNLSDLENGFNISDNELYTKGIIGEEVILSEFCNFDTDARLEQNKYIGIKSIKIEKLFNVWSREIELKWVN